MSSPSNFEPFCACDNIAAYYESLKVPSRKTVGLFGGKSYTWFVNENGQPFQVRCQSNIFSLGFGLLHIESKVASDLSTWRAFKVSSVVDPHSSKIYMRGISGFSTHEVRLPFHGLNLSSGPHSIKINF